MPTPDTAAERIAHAVAQIDYALADSRIDSGSAAAAWLRTIRAGLTEE